MLNFDGIVKRFGQDRAHFAAIEYNLRERFNSVVYAENDGVLVYLKEDEMALSYGFTKERAKEVFVKTGIKPTLVGCSSTEECEAFNETFGLKTEIVSWQVRYEKPCGAKIPKDTKVIRLEPTEENAEFVFSRYDHGYSKDELKKVMETRGIFASVTGGRLSGFIGSHEEGAIGMLVVDEDFRKIGLGSYLVDYMVKKFLSEGKVAYANIVVGNEASYRMHLKMGYVPSDKKIFWCW